MNERMRPTGNGAPLATNNNKLLGPDIGPKKTMIVVVIVVGCFAVLWPKVFQPMMFGGNDDYIKPNAADRSNGNSSQIKIITYFYVVVYSFL